MPKVLIVEDEAPIAKAYQHVLEESGFQVIASHQADEALTLANKEKPDLILLDVMLPNVNGLDLLKHLADKKLLPQTKVVALSNLDDQRIVDEAFKLGVVDFLRKVDFTPRQLVDVVNKYLS